MADAPPSSDSLSDVLQHLHAQREALAPPLQSTGCLLMIAPVYSAFNDDCSADNHYLAASPDVARAAEDAAACMREFSSCVAALRSRGVKVWVFVPDDDVRTPDAHFPNNWISTYAGDGAAPAAVDVHSMRWPSRRLERRAAVVDSLLAPCPPLPLPLYRRVHDLTAGEEGGQVLEGTGSLVLDRVSRRAFVARSQRSDAAAAQAWASMHRCVSSLESFL